jgi:hypothetical protein
LGLPDNLYARWYVKNSPLTANHKSYTNRKTVSWGVIVVNWLTIGSAEAENNLTSLISQRTIRGPNSNNRPKSNNLAHFDIGLSTHAPEDESNAQEMRTRQASATTADVPVFYKTASLKDEGGLLRQDGVRESWIKECDEAYDAVSELREPEKSWEGSAGKAWDAAGERKSWVTINDRVVREERSNDSLGPLRIV